MGSSNRKPIHGDEHNVQPRAFKRIDDFGRPKRTGSKDAIETFYHEQEQKKPDIKNISFDVPDELGGTQSSSRRFFTSRTTPYPTETQIETEHKHRGKLTETTRNRKRNGNTVCQGDISDRFHESSPSPTSTEEIGYDSKLVLNEIETGRREQIDAANNTKTKKRNKKTKERLRNERSSDLEHETVSSTADKQSNSKIARPASADLLTVALNATATDGYYETKRANSSLSRFDEKTVAPIPDEQIRLKDPCTDGYNKDEKQFSTQNDTEQLEQETRIQAMTDEADRLLSICTHQHLTHITPNQSSSMCPSEFKKKILGIEIYLNDLRSQIDKIRREKNEYLNRLSSVAGARLTENNPNITDLNDANRPVKLAEKLGKIYDDEWTDAMQELENKNSKKKEKKHEKIVYHLFSLIKVIYTTCQQKAEQQIGNFLLLKDQSRCQVEYSWSDIPIEQRQSFIESRKKVAVANIEVLQKIMKDDDIYKKEIHSLDPPLDEKLLKLLQDSPYFKKCLEICWFFVIQDPPLYLDILPLEGTLIVKETHKEYTRSGSTVKYVVWPALYLHCLDNKKGPLLAKGVVQPEDPVDTSK